jgi:oligopeptide transport system substrate-binding protein
MPFALKPPSTATLIIAMQHICVLLALTLFAALSGCGQSGKSPLGGQTLHRGLGSEPSTLDPAAAADNFSQEVLRDMYEGLTTESPTGEVIPGVALAWSVDPSGTQYSFQLRPDARWSNGQPVKAQDFVIAFRRIVDPTKASPVADDLRIIAGAASIISGKRQPAELGVTATSDSKLVIKLEKPAPYLPQLLTHSAAFPIYSDASASSHSSATWVSNGPYVLSKWSPGSSIELIRNPHYWDRRSVQIPTVQYQFVPDDNSQYARYRAGQLDVTDTVPANAIPELRRENSEELVVAPFLATAFYGLNLSVPPFAGNAKLRQAMAMAIDRRRLVESLGFGQAEAYGFVPPGTWNFRPQSWPWRGLSESERVREARRLYSEAGYSVDTPLHLRLLFYNNPVTRNTAVLIAAMWKDSLGIDTVLIEEEYRVFLESRHDKSRWDVARLGWLADYNDASNFLDIFRGHSSNNDAGYHSSAFDALMDEAERTADANVRKAILEQSEQLMLSDYPIVPLYFYVSKRLVKPYVHGVQPNPLNRVPSKLLSIVNQ